MTKKELTAYLADQCSRYADELIKDAKKDSAEYNALWLIRHYAAVIYCMNSDINDSVKDVCRDSAGIDGTVSYLNRKKKEGNHDR